MFCSIFALLAEPSQAKMNQRAYLQVFIEAFKKVPGRKRKTKLSYKISNNCNVFDIVKLDMGGRENLYVPTRRDAYFCKNIESLIPDGHIRLLGQVR